MNNSTLSFQNGNSLITSLIRKLMTFNDEYSRKLVKVFSSYLETMDFVQMQKEYLEARPQDNINSRNRWTAEIRCLILEVIYPAIQTKEIYQDGNVYEITYKKASKKEVGKQYIFIDDNLHEILFCTLKYENNVSDLNNNIWKRINSGFKI